MKKGTICKLLATSALACIASASQAAAVEWWNYSIDMQWTAAAFSPAESGFTKSYDSGHDSRGAAYANGINPNKPDTISWGDKGGVDNFLSPYTGGGEVRSSLYIDGSAGFRNGWNGYYGPNGIHGGQTAINMFRHINNTIDARTADLTYAQLTMTIDLGAWNGSVYDPVSVPDIKFDIYFYETPNEPGPVDDILLFAKAEGSVLFQYDGGWYSFDYTVNGLQLIDAATCSSVSNGALTGACWGFTTPEHSQSIPQLSFSIATSPIPEPETYAMLLAGLSMVGVIVRRRSNRN
ncbi:MAG: THxN family PEP-CTERM protein [Betaproteobacteria bacterium]|nr:THxN family PEP-CTERM protein [Betaproteobacteria bacterium]